jgi:hypothetical protein
MTTRHLPLCRAALAAAVIVAISGAAFAQQSDPPAKKADPTGQHSPQGDPGQLETDSTKGSYPSSPQGGTPNAMQAKPKGSDTGDQK